MYDKFKLIQIIDQYFHENYTFFSSNLPFADNFFPLNPRPHFLYICLIYKIIQSQEIKREIISGNKMPGNLAPGNFLYENSDKIRL
jgi:hypothetical protein